MRECPLPSGGASGNCSWQIAEYWRANVPSHPYYNPEVECLVVVLLDVRKRIKGHYLVSVGLLDSVLIHPREMFRAAVAASASSVVMVHNHPSGDPTPSEADIKATHEMVEAGKQLKIEVVDHLVMGAGQSFTSLKDGGDLYPYKPYGVTIELNDCLHRIAHLRKVHRMAGMTAADVARFVFAVVLTDLPMVSAAIDKFARYRDAEGFADSRRAAELLYRLLEQRIPRKRAALKGGAR